MILVLMACLIAAVVVFDLGPPLAFNDDHLYAAASRRLASGNGLHTATQTALALPQVILGAASWVVGAHDQRALRLLTLPFLLVAVASSAMTAGILGAAPRWRLLTGLVLMGSPLALALSTSFMSDVFFVGFLTLALYGGVRWLERNDSRVLTVAAVTLATLQRQVGAAVLVAIVLAIAAAWRQGQRPRRIDFIAVTVMAAGVCGALVFSLAVLTPGSPTVASPALLAEVEVREYADLLVYSVPVFGLIFLPFAFGVAERLVSTRPSIRTLVPPAAVVIVGLCAISLVVLISTGNGLPGDYLSRYGLGPPHVPFVFPQAELAQPAPQLNKPALLPGVAWMVVGGVGVSSFAMLALLALRGARRLTASPASVLLVGTAAVEFVLLGIHAHVDRYAFSVAAPLLPLVSVAAAKAPRPRAGATASMLVLGLFGVAYVVGEFDYQAWQGARDRAARLAFARYGVANVDAGFEADFTYYVLPTYERTGKIVGIPNPARAHLEFAARGDSRPGVDYNSTAPGRIVVAEGPAGR